MAALVVTGFDIRKEGDKFFFYKAIEMPGYDIRKQDWYDLSVSVSTMRFFNLLELFLFSTRRKRVGFYLFVIFIVALWAARKPFNAWLVEIMGERMSTVASFFVEYPCLLYCLCTLIALGTVLYVLNHLQGKHPKKYIFQLL